MRGDRLASFLLFVITAAPLLAVVPFPTQDGPAHLYTAHVLQALGDASNAPLLRRFFEPSSAAAATRVGTWMVQTLSYWCGPALVPTLLIFAVVSGLFLVCAGGQADRARCFFPRCFVPAVAYSFVVRMGFFTFCLALPFVVLSVRLWLGKANDASHLRYALFAGAMALISLLHPFPALWVLVVCVSASVVSLALSRKRAIVELAWLAVASTPLVPLGSWQRSAPGGDYEWDRVATRLGGILAGGPFAGSHSWALVASSLSATLLVSLAVLALRDQLRSRAPGDAYPVRLLAALGAALLMALLSPEEGLGGGYIGVRCQLLLFLLLLECGRRWQISRRADILISAAVLACSLATAASTLLTMRTVSAAYREIEASAAVLPHSTTVLTVMAGEWTASHSPDLTHQVRPLLHAGNLLGLSADRVMLANYQADLGYFAVSFRPTTTPFGVLFDRSLFDWGPPWLQWDRLPTFEGGVGHIGVWDEAQLLRTIRNAADYRRVICEHYEEVYRSPDWPWVIYRLTDDAQRKSTPTLCR